MRAIVIVMSLLYCTINGFHLYTKISRLNILNRFTCTNSWKYSLHSENEKKDINYPSKLKGKSIVDNSLYKKILNRTVKHKSESNQIINSTRLWIQNFVVTHNLCPWAAASLEPSKLKIKVNFKSFAQVERVILCVEILRDIISFSSADSSSIHTMLICLPKLNDFDEYLDLFYLVEELLENEKLDSHLQLASFHPHYRFQGTDENAIENWTNRSPYPMIHLLRVSEVSAALSTYKRNPDDIWKDNVNKMKELEKMKIIP